MDILGHRYLVTATKKVYKSFRELPEIVQERLGILLKQLAIHGPVAYNWPTYSKLGNNRYHCHLKFSYVACWICEDDSIQIECVMLAVVKTPHTKTTAFKILGSIDKETLDYLNARFGEENVGVDEDIVDVIDSNWYKDISKKVMPGTVVRTYRENFELTQQQLAEKVGVRKSSYISDIEHGRRAVSKNIAKKFAEFFGVSVEMFL